MLSLWKKTKLYYSGKFPSSLPNRLCMLAMELWLFLWLLLMRRATLRQGEPSQARQANQGIDSQMELDMFVMSAPVRQPLTTGCGTGCIQSVNGHRSKPERDGDIKMHLFLRAVHMWPCLFCFCRTPSRTECPRKSFGLAQSRPRFATKWLQS